MSDREMQLPSAGAEPGRSAASADLDTLVSEIGATYPLMAFTAMADEHQSDEDVFDGQILAGLVTP